MRDHVLVVEDDDTTRRLLIDGLRDEHIEARYARDVATARAAVTSNRPSLAVVDIGLPDGSGLDLLRELKSDGIPVIVLSGRGGEVDRVVGLELGADDYVVKPFYLRELVARIRAVLQRARTSPTRSLQFGDASIDVAAREVTRAGVLVDLTPREFDLLVHLVRSPRTVFSREQLLRDVWGSSSEWQTARTINEHIRRLRQKLEEDPSVPRKLVSVTGVGYRFDP